MPFEKIKIYVCIGLMAAMASCKPTTIPTEYARTSAGVRYQALVPNPKDTNSSKPKYGDIIEFHLRYGNDTTILFDSYKNKQTVFKQITRPAFATSFENGLQLLGIGDSAVFVCNADSVFSLLLNEVRPTEIAAGSDLKFWVKMVNIRDEAAEITNYLAQKNILQKPDPSGIIILNTPPTTGIKPKSGDSVVVHYTSQKLDGTLIENSRTTQPLRSVVGIGAMIDAWEIALPRLAQGSKTTLICPSYLCYAGKRKGNILPFTPLVFDIEIIKIMPQAKNLQQQ
jgi:hypothetical protein